MKFIFKRDSQIPPVEMLLDRLKNYTSCIRYVTFKFVKSLKISKVKSLESLRQMHHKSQYIITNSIRTDLEE